jgi:hypothetical protein
LRPDAAWSTAPISARHDEAGTLHCFAAASTSISRAAAPASRSGFQEDITLSLPPVPVSV